MSTSENKRFPEFTLEHRSSGDLRVSLSESSTWCPDLCVFGACLLRARSPQSAAISAQVSLTSMASDGAESAGSRFSGSADDLYAVLKPFVIKQGVSFCRYADESKTVTAGKLQRGLDGVEGHHDLLAALKKLQSNLSFPQTTVKGSLDLIHERHGQKWRMTSTEHADWKETLARRIRNLCRAVAQGELKSASSKWVRSLPWNAALDEVGDASTPSTSKRANESRPKITGKSKDADTSTTYGFDKELHLPYRIKPGKRMETGLPLTADATTDENGWLMAEWPDGEQAPIENVTADVLRGLITGRTSKGQGTGELWSMEHKSSHNHVCVKQKVDHWLLLVGYEQAKHLVCVKMNLWAPIADEREQVETSHPSCVQGVEFMKKLMTRYCNGEIEKHQLNNEKNKLLKEAGLKTVQAKTARKRPAAASTQPEGHAEKQRRAVAPVQPNKDEDDEEKNSEAAEDEEEEDEDVVAKSEVPVQRSSSWMAKPFASVLDSL